MKIVHLSDLHVGSNVGNCQPSVIGGTRSDRVRLAGTAHGGGGQSRPLWPNVGGNPCVRRIRRSVSHRCSARVYERFYVSHIRVCIRLWAEARRAALWREGP